MERHMGYLIATDHFPADGSTDISHALQELIDTNPNRTIFFPDGTYILGTPVLTPADPRKSVDLILSNFAVLRASDHWNDVEAMIRLGAKDKANDIYTPGSNYGLTGGIIDGNNKAKAVSIDGGRETHPKLQHQKRLGRHPYQAWREQRLLRQRYHRREHHRHRRYRQRRRSDRGL